MVVTRGVENARESEDTTHSTQLNPRQRCPWMGRRAPCSMHNEARWLFPTMKLRDWPHMGCPARIWARDRPFSVNGHRTRGCRNGGFRRLSDLVGGCPLPEIFYLPLFELLSYRCSIPTFRLRRWTIQSTYYCLLDGGAGRNLYFDASSSPSANLDSCNARVSLTCSSPSSNLDSCNARVSLT